ncbi:GNAT family N-acetyltransferase [Pelagibacterium limicola]|uniref:GNAT family N-acetyltransferase n=1 Tax=Pelagibacterium limicola TaxID=2791022 RepID=UPI0018AFBFDA|nr:GNAT family N-acetyltransferase [Pelagibacterium limicola]
MTIEIKLLGPGDIALLLRADTDVFDNPIDPALAKAYLEHPDYLIVLALEGDAVVGMASGLYYFHPDKPREFFVNEVGVADRAQRRGIGKAVTRALLEAARVRGADYAWVGTENDNLPAKALYEAIGGRGQGMAYYEFDLTRLERP